ncbi:hypothetical protein [Nonomuraea sp. SBT364]|uniref:hypothetical protein n=1 Tax=Nonomuraea sp. SBT364 TaxID=1580530 RepID=UPI00066D9628|nr:hypothetical protein [Nonomuraea sp. SBT364]
MDLIQTSGPHLAPGMILDAPVEYDDLLLRFGDDCESRAELLRDETGRPILRVGGYMTMDGTVVAERVWTVSELIESAGRRLIRLGDPVG